MRKRRMGLEGERGDENTGDARTKHGDEAEDKGEEMRGDKGTDRERDSHGDRETKRERESEINNTPVRPKTHTDPLCRRATIDA